MERKHKHSLEDYEKFKKGIHEVWVEDNKNNSVSFQIPYEMALNLRVGDELLFNDYREEIAFWLLAVDEKIQKYDLTDLHIKITRKIWMSGSIDFDAIVINGYLKIVNE